MKSFIVLAMLVAVALAAPAGPDSEAVIVRQSGDNIGVGEYNNEYETSNGIQHAESGKLTNVGTENEAMEVRGQFAYTGPDGVVYQVVYTAGVNGFQPQGAHIPQA